MRYALLTERRKNAKETEHSCAMLLCKKRVLHQWSGPAVQSRKWDFNDSFLSRGIPLPGPDEPIRMYTYPHYNTYIAFL